MPDLRQTIADRLAPEMDALLAAPDFNGLNKPLKKLLRDPFGKETLVAFLAEKQAQGALKPCPNLGDRRSNAIEAWNRFAAGGLEAIKPHEHRHIAGMLDGAWRDAIFAAVWDTRLEVPSEGQHRGRSEALDPAVVRAMLEGLPDRIATLVESGKLDPDMTDCEIYCSITGERLQVELRDWQPVLHRLDLTTANFVEVEAISAGKPLRHMEMNLPTGELLLADWFRIPGFNEGMDALVGDTGREINCDQGADQHTRDNFEGAGFAHISVGNTSPTIYRDGELIRLGHHDEETLYDEAGERIAEGPEEAGCVCTDLWWVTIADKQVITDILMRSDRHADRAAAEAAIDAYVEGSWGVTRIQLEPGPLHVYFPGGHAGSEPDGIFGKAGLPRITGLDEQIVLSRTPIAGLDPEMVLETGFTQGHPATAVAAPATEDENDLSM